MKFDQLITVYNERDIFLQKSYTKCVGETIPKPFSKKSKFSLSLILQFYSMTSWTLSKYIETELQNTCFYLLESFLKNKAGASLPALFCAWVLEKNIFLVI